MSTFTLDNLSVSLIIGTWEGKYLENYDMCMCVTVYTVYKSLHFEIQAASLNKCVLTLVLLP